jgi:hypothetical protein
LIVVFLHSLSVNYYDMLDEIKYLRKMCWDWVCCSVVQSVPGMHEAQPCQKEKKPEKWLTLVILATQKAEIRRIAVQSQPGQIDPICKKPITKKVWWRP